MFSLIFTLLGLFCVTTVRAGATLRYSSGCSVDLCDLVNVSNGSNSSSCSQPPPCYRFETATRAFCGPQVVCSLFDACINGSRCATNTSICVLNTCCLAAICMPLALTSSCSMYTTSNSNWPATWSTKICPNATWSDNGTLVTAGLYNGSYWYSSGDLFLDKNNNIFVTDTSNFRIMRIAANTSAVSVAVAMSVSSYISMNIFVDNNGTIYSSESWSTYSTTYYRIVKYTSGNGVTIFGPTTCGSALNELCGSAGLAVDQTGNIYVSDSVQNRVIKLVPFASTFTVVAGTTGSSGSQLNQLSNPSGIFLDSNNTLYVADQNNYRVMKFNPGSTVGTILFTLASFQTPLSVIVDNYGSVYTGTSNGVFKWVPGSSSLTAVISTMYWSTIRVRMDTFGNLYTTGYSTNTIYKYNITSNFC